MARDSTFRASYWPGDLFRLAFRNVFRHAGRTSLTLSLIAAGVVCLILCGGFVRDALIQLRESTIHSQLGHLQIYRKGYFEEGTRRPYRYMIEDGARLVATIKVIPGIDDVTTRLAFNGVINNGKSDFAIVGEGVEAEKEARLGSLVKILEGRNLQASDRYGAVIGEGVAAATKLKPGDRATLLINTAEGALNNIEFDIVGVAQSFSKEFDAHAVRISMDGAQELLAARNINAIVILLKETDDTARVRRQLESLLDPSLYEIKSWDELADFYAKTAALYQRQFTILQGIILVAVLLCVVNSVNMSIFERTGEFGTLLALGSRRRVIFGLIVLENFLLGGVGSVVGALLGFVAAVAISHIGLPMPPPPNSSIGYLATIRVDLWTLVSAGAVGLAATTIASVMPARRASRSNIVDALRQN